MRFLKQFHVVLAILASPLTKSCVIKPALRAALKRRGHN